MAWIYWWPIHA